MADGLTALADWLSLLLLLLEHHIQIEGVKHICQFIHTIVERFANAIYKVLRLWISLIQTIHFLSSQDVIVATRRDL